jgi:putative phosphoesterase
MPEQKPVTLGIVADTHIPDRVNRLHPGIIPSLKSAGVDMVLHAGDISTPAVLEELGQVAPVIAVRGNRDWLLAGRLNWKERMEINGVHVMLVHGHGSLREYLKQKIAHYTNGYNVEQYIPGLVSSYGEADITIFGHTHCTETIWRGGRLYFNPGSASTVSPYSKEITQGIGLLKIGIYGLIDVEVVKLSGWELKNRQWVIAGNQP